MGLVLSPLRSKTINMKIFFLMTCASALAAVLIGCSSQATQATTSQQTAAAMKHAACRRRTSVICR